MSQDSNVEIDDLKLSTLIGLLPLLWNILMRFEIGLNDEFHALGYN